MDFLETSDIQIVGVAVALVAVVAAVAYFSSKKPKGCLDPENFKEFKLVKKTQLSHNVAKFKFELPTPTSVLGLPIGKHMSCRGKDSQGEEVIKPYTPTTLDSDVGCFELVIKVFTRFHPHPPRPYSHSQWGLIGRTQPLPYCRSKWGFIGRNLNRLSKPGLVFCLHAPLSKAFSLALLLCVFKYPRLYEASKVRLPPMGRFKYQPGQVRAFGMLAGGSGITPMFQVARAILENPKDMTKVHLIYANVTYEDILLKFQARGFLYCLGAGSSGW
ncbi:NADH:cytochrome B5 reductase 1 [Actinidia rufa]|uniref:cytochrome-b5 reductase n=1 Tax=Actinidia rufa TaxID=165716 RepID=A0A7J0FHB1_9ERIC|nr:NADH:cytochrome B5 reductase 1 [Actinidia rufa]